MPDDSSQVAEQQELSLVQCEKWQEADGMWNEWRKVTAELMTAYRYALSVDVDLLGEYPPAKGASSIWQQKTEPATHFCSKPIYVVVSFKSYGVAGVHLIQALLHAEQQQQECKQPNVPCRR